ncbi:MAG: sulfotransferase domain-containing protein [Oscillatoriales cyanobacterium RM1_1_9]|nr:sulfotransferase domain-containing protein [Oscillatoriales cyanobacterium SM2_3_0]NJO46413.1 sulfotransferase domain-containing protein [Oscillatoriales cyanobacterium RM2_1_1]NJO71243.1 sulfotransferase domain-containing protein [Oscillatoriales cyanobacterium RM1_1_9]
MNHPGFIIIGAAKSGTTTLYQYLCRHPQIYMSTPKEPDFFSVDENYQRGLDWYFDLFKNAQPEQISGEASTTYSRLHQHPHTVDRMVKVLPDVKLIYIMRHPVDRAYSFYVHRLKGSRHKPELAFEQTITSQSEFVDSSYYLEQIEKYLRVYPRESLLLLLMEDLIKNPAETLKRIVEFIGADPGVDLVQAGTVVANKAGDHPEWLVRKQLTESFKSFPGAELISSMVPKFAKNRLYRAIKNVKYEDWKSQQYVPPPMLPETRQMLLEKFHQPNQKLSEFLARDLSHWNQ